MIRQVLVYLFLGFFCLNTNAQNLMNPFHVKKLPDSSKPKVTKTKERGMYDVRGSLFTYCDLQPEFFYNDRIEHTIFPSNQVRPIKFMAELENNGSSSVSGAKMIVEVWDDNSNLVFSDSSVASTLNFTPRLDSVVWTGLSLTSQIYQVIISVTFDSISLDSDLSNNSDTLRLEVSNPVSGYFARDNNEFSNQTIFNDGFANYILGNIFTATDNFLITGLDVAFSYETNPGSQVCISIIEYDSLFNVTNSFDDCANSIYHSVSSTEISNTSLIWKHIPFSLPFQLNAGHQYFASVATDLDIDMAYVLSGGPTYPDAITSFVFNSTDATWYYLTEIPMLRMSYNTTISVDENNLNNFSVSPNPAENQIMITNINSNEEYFICDISGKEIKSGTLEKTSSTIDVHNLPNGIYTISIGKITQKLIIFK